MIEMEVIILILLFIFSVALVYINFDTALSVLVVLSVLLHKEFFSIYRWDLLPVRVLMFGFFVVILGRFFVWCKNKYDFEKIKDFISSPFVIIMALMWFFNGLSIIFSENIKDSILLFGFFTTITVLGLSLYQRLKSDTKTILKLVNMFIYTLFGLTLFGFLQLVVYKKTGFIFGSLWNVPGKIPRIGATFWDVNHFGALLAALLPVLGVFILTASSWKQRLVRIALFIPMVVMLLLTNSRSSWILAIVAFIVFIILRMVRKWNFKAVYVVIACMAGLFSIGMLEYSDKSSPLRAKIKEYFHYRIDSFDSHLYLLKGSYQVLEKFPYLGGGYGSFFEQFSKTEISSTYFGRDPISLTSGTGVPAHSIWGRTAAETGWLGLMVLSAFVLLISCSLLYVSLTNKDNKKSMIAAGMVASIMGWFTAGIFYSYKAEFFWLVLFLYFFYGLSVSNFKLKNLISFFTKGDRIYFIILLSISAGLILFGLGKNHLIPWDEAIYAKIAKNMVEFNRYFVMRWDLSRVWYEKPPLYMWLAAGVMKILGVSEFSARLPSAVFGILTVWLVYKFGKMMFNKTTGYISALALATTTQFIYYSRLAMLDVSTTFFITLSLYFYWKLIFKKDNVKNRVLTGIFIGMGALIKNVVGFLPFLVIFIYELYLIVFEKQKIKFKRYISIFLPAMAVFLPWHVFMYLKFGQDFIDNYIIYHVIKRATHAIEDKGKPFFWYVIVLKVSLRIWFVGLLGALPFGLYKAFFNKDKDTGRKYIFLTLAFLVMFLFFSSSKSKLVWYIIPLYPMAVIMVGRFGERILNFIMKRIKSLDIPVFKLGAVYLLTFFALGYTFVVKDLIYPPDLTGAQAELLKLKEKMYGLKDIVYVDKVSPPVIKYYLDGPYKQVEYSQLERLVKDPPYTMTFVYITKESRQERLSGVNLNTRLVKNLKDHSLGFVDSQYAADKLQLENISEKIKDLESKKNTNNLSSTEFEKLFKLYKQKDLLNQKIKNGLAEAGSNAEVGSDFEGRGMDMSIGSGGVR